MLAVMSPSEWTDFIGSFWITVAVFAISIALSIWPRLASWWRRRKGTWHILRHTREPGGG